MQQIQIEQLKSVTGGVLPAVAVVVVSSAARQAATAALFGALGAAVEWALESKKS